MAEKKKKKVTKEKPLEKMTSKELRELAMKTPEIVGVHGMNKDELISEIKKVRGIVEEEKKKTDSTVREVKAKIKDVKAKQAKAKADNETKLASIYRRRISRLKKKTRRAA